MSGKLLTRSEVSGFRELADNYRKYAKSQLIEMDVVLDELVTHIEDVGVFAPSEPTREDIREAIAKAQGWASDGGCWVLRTPAEGVLDKSEYRPDEDLGQAVEAAVALGEHIKLSSWGREYRVFFGRDWPKEERFETTTEVAYAISRHLHDRIQEQT